MLLRFEVSNHRSILDPVEFSMVAVDNDRSATRGFETLSERILATSGIYGPNASGKSNILDAIAWISTAVAHSLRKWEDFVPRDAHRFGQGPDLPSSFAVDFVVEGIRHSYNLEIGDSEVIYESLCSYPERRPRTLFEREGNEIDFRRGTMKSGGTRSLLTPTTLALSAAIRVGDPTLAVAGRALASMEVLGLRRRPDPRYFCSLHSPSARLFVSEQRNRDDGHTFSPAGRATALELLRFADPWIDNVTTTGDDRNGPGHSNGQLLFVHQVGDEPETVELDEESDGTRAWFHLLGPVLNAIRKGSILLFDEIDASLHPRLSVRLLDLFRDPQTNPRGAQLIFTSHDTSLLNDLNRDEVWFTEKTSDGATRLVALAEYSGNRVRKSVNLERAYLQGRFGALPNIDQFDIRRAVGLSADFP